MEAVVEIVQAWTVEKNKVLYRFVTMPQQNNFKMVFAQNP